jgi:phage-related holin
MAPASIMNFLSNEDTPLLAAGFFIFGGTKYLSELSLFFQSILILKSALILKVWGKKINGKENYKNLVKNDEFYT